MQVDFGDIDPDLYSDFAKHKLDFFIHLALVADRKNGLFFPDHNSELVANLSSVVEHNGGRFVLISSVLAAFPHLSEYAFTRHRMEIVLADKNPMVFRLGVIPDPSLDTSIEQIFELGCHLRVLPVPLGRVWISGADQISRIADALTHDAPTGTFSLVQRSDSLRVVVDEMFAQRQVMALSVPTPRRIFYLLLVTWNWVARFFPLESRFTTTAMSGIGVDHTTASTYHLLAHSALSETAAKSAL